MTRYTNSQLGIRVILKPCGRKRDEFSRGRLLWDGQGWLQLAVQRNNYHACELLIQFGVNPKRVDLQGETARGIAETIGKIELCRLFPEPAIEAVPPGAVSVEAFDIKMSGGLAAQFRELADLKTSSVLTQGEFEVAKVKLLR